MAVQIAPAPAHIAESTVDTLALVATVCPMHGGMVLELVEDCDTLRVIALVRDGCGCRRIVEAARRRFLGC